MGNNAGAGMSGGEPSGFIKTSASYSTLNLNRKSSGNIYSNGKITNSTDSMSKIKRKKSASTSSLSNLNGGHVVNKNKIANSILKNNGKEHAVANKLAAANSVNSASTPSPISSSSGEINSNTLNIKNLKYFLYGNYKCALSSLLKENANILVKST